jgi:hypothetical protein
MANKYFRGFEKLFKFAKSQGENTGKSINTIVGTKPNVGNLKKNQETIKKLTNVTDQYVTKAGSVDPGLKEALRKSGSKSLQKTDKILRKTKKADGGRIGRRLGGGADMAKKKTNVQKIKETFGPKTKNLKPVDKKKQKGLAKLPIEVRNKMGYAKKGGRA